MNTYTSIFEVSTAGRSAVERDKGKIDIAAVEEILAADDMDLDSVAAGEDQCGSSGPAISVTSSCN
jgi:hypothetical protein